MMQVRASCEPRSNTNVCSDPVDLTAETPAQEGLYHANIDQVQGLRTREMIPVQSRQHPESDKSRVYVGKTGETLSEHLLHGLDLAGWDRIIQPGARVAVKPNYCWPTIEPGVTTSNALLDELLRLLATRTDQVSVVES